MKKLSSVLITLLFMLSMLASFTAGVEYERGDVDHDGNVTVADVTCLIDYLLQGTWPEDPVTPPEAHEWVDLGLPSGTLWATCNVGAETPEEYGDFFAWGETMPKKVYNWGTYSLCNGTYKTLTKYCTASYYGTVDDKTELDPEDDAAYVLWGESWRMPTVEQMRELIDNCNWGWSTQNGVQGHLVTGPNGYSIFIPAAGYINASTHNDAGNAASIWSRSLNSDRTFEAYNIGFNPAMVETLSSARMLGLSVRAVRAQ